MNDIEQSRDRAIRRMEEGISGLKAIAELLESAAKDRTMFTLDVVEPSNLAALVNLVEREIREGHDDLRATLPCEAANIKPITANFEAFFDTFGDRVAPQFRKDDERGAATSNRQDGGLIDAPAGQRRKAERKRK